MTKLENLFEQTKSLKFIGKRLSGEPEVLHEIQYWVDYGMSRDQIKIILEYVPSVFPEDWKSPDSYDEMSEKERKAYDDIMKIGPLGIPGPYIQRVIELGIDFRNRYSRR
jgi:hypothetical protein